MNNFPELKEGEEVAVMKTNHGTIVLRFFEEHAPKHVESFKNLIKQGFYDNLAFHRVIPGFMIQGGCPNTKDGNRAGAGTGNPGYQVPAEFNEIRHDRGILSAARSASPNSAGSQFFIMVAPAGHLDGQYSAFGAVVQGMAAVDAIVDLDRDGMDFPLPSNPATIEKVTLESWPLG